MESVANGGADRSARVPDPGSLTADGHATHYLQPTRVRRLTFKQKVLAALLIGIVIFDVTRGLHVVVGSVHPTNVGSTTVRKVVSPPPSVGGSSSGQVVAKKGSHR